MGSSDGAEGNTSARSAPSITPPAAANVEELSEDVISAKERGVIQDIMQDHSLDPQERNCRGIGMVEWDGQRLPWHGQQREGGGRWDGGGVLSKDFETLALEAKIAGKYRKRAQELEAARREEERLAAQKEEEGAT